MMETTGPFRAQLQAAVNARHSRMNPFTEKWVNGELTRAQLGAWVCQHYQYVSQFPRWCATVYGDCPDADARDFLLENIVEESGVKRRSAIRFGGACDVTPRRRDGPAAPTTRADRLVLRPRVSPSTWRPPACWSGWSQVPGIYRRNLPPLKTHYWFNDREVEFFAIHIEADEVHGERGYQIVERHCTTPARSAEALDQVRQATEMRWQYMTGLHRAYVLKEDL